MLELGLKHVTTLSKPFDCSICHGGKKLLGMGCFAVDCHECKGTGFAPNVKLVEPVKPADESAKVNEVKIENDNNIFLADAMDKADARKKYAREKMAERRAKFRAQKGVTNAT